ncbi:MAG: PAS domain-containing protein [Coriobacteriia bacterium]
MTRGATTSVPDADRFARLLTDSEQWLVERIIGYAKALGYTPYTSTLEEAWRISIRSMSGSLVEAARDARDRLEIHCDEDLTADPSASFGMQEARLHRSRGVPLAMFMSLMKYYAQSYQDLCGTVADDEERHEWRLLVARFFDRMEIGFASEWAAMSGQDAAAELQQRARDSVDEKVKYLTIFESLMVPVLLLDATGRIENVNEAAAMLFRIGEVSGSAYYSHVSAGEVFAPLVEEIARFAARESLEYGFEKAIETSDGLKHFLVRMKRMRDVSGKFLGTTVVLTDITGRKAMEDAILESRAQYRALFENMDDAFARHDTVFDDSGAPIDYIVLEVNPAFERVFGLNASEVEGRRASEVWSVEGSSPCD